MTLSGESGSVPEVTVSLFLTLRALSSSVTVVILWWRLLSVSVQTDVGSNYISAPAHPPFLLFGGEMTGPGQVSTSGKPQWL